MGLEKAGKVQSRMWGAKNQTLEVGAVSSHLPGHNFQSKASTKPAFLQVIPTLMLHTSHLISLFIFISFLALIAYFCLLPWNISGMRAGTLFPW